MTMSRNMAIKMASKISCVIIEASGEQIFENKSNRADSDYFDYYYMHDCPYMKYNSEKQKLNKKYKMVGKYEVNYNKNDSIRLPYMRYFDAIKISNGKYVSVYIKRKKSNFKDWLSKVFPKFAPKQSIYLILDSITYTLIDNKYPIPNFDYGYTFDMYIDMKIKDLYRKKSDQITFENCTDVIQDVFSPGLRVRLADYYTK